MMHQTILVGHHFFVPTSKNILETKNVEKFLAPDEIQILATFSNYPTVDNVDDDNDNDDDDDDDKDWNGEN